MSTTPTPPAFVSIQTPQKYRPRFVPRRYPMLNALAIVLYVCAGLCVVSLVASLAIMFAGTATIFAQDAKAGAGATIVNLFLALTTTLLHAGGIVGFLLPAELIKVVLDIQANTQEAAHYARQST